jgi:hypothetical protein
LQGGPGDLDDHELLQRAEAQCDLCEPELSRLDPVRPDLGLNKGGPAGLAPGEQLLDKGGANGVSVRVSPPRSA